MNYYLALDKRKSKNPDTNKKDRYDIIDLSVILNKKTSSIIDIANFTSKFDNKAELLAFLLENNYIDKKNIDKDFVICYQKNKKNGIESPWAKCSKKISNTDEILYGNEANLLNPNRFINELLDYQINDLNFISYNDLSNIEKFKVSTILLLANELLTNDYYKYSGVSEQAYGLLNYSLNIRNNNIVDNKRFYIHINKLIEHLAFKYDRFDAYKTTPLINKKGETIINYRQLFEFAIFYTQIKRRYANLNNELTNKYPINIKEFKKIRKLTKDNNDCFEQLTFF